MNERTDRLLFRVGMMFTFAIVLIALFAISGETVYNYTMRQPITIEPIETDVCNDYEIENKSMISYDIFLSSMNYEYTKLSQIILTQKKEDVLGVLPKLKSLKETFDKKECPEVYNNFKNYFSQGLGYQIKAIQAVEDNNKEKCDIYTKQLEENFILAREEADRILAGLY